MTTGQTDEDLTLRYLQGWTQIRGQEYWKMTDDRGETLATVFQNSLGQWVWMMRDRRYNSDELYDAKSRSDAMDSAEHEIARRREQGT